MTCGHSRDDLWALVHGDEDPARTELLQAQVAQCPVCASAVAQMEALVSQLGGALAAPDVPGEPRAPESIAGYRILRRLGAGGMGVVFEAEQQLPQRRVALKVIRPGVALDDWNARLLEREARALARLSHPGIAAIYEAGRTADGQHYFAMELVEGRPPGAAGLPMEARAAARLVRDAAAAVGYAHQRGVIHRDLKPANLLVDTGGRVRVLDFGLARLSDAEGEARLTRSGAIVGTLAYMSPEQARGAGDAADIRTDVYALGAILYELITGALPCDVVGRPLHESVRAICENTPTWPARRRPGLASDLCAIVMKALEKEPERRYASATDLAADLDRFLTHHPVSARRPGPFERLGKLWRRHRLVSSLLLAVFGLAVGSAALFAVQSRWIAAERDEADRQAAKFRRINAVLSGFLQSPNPWEGGGRETRVIDVLDRLAEEIERGMDEDPLVAAALRHTLGVTYRAFSRLADAEKHLRFALETRRERLGAGHADTVASLNELGELLYEAGRVEEAHQALQAAFDWRRRALAQDDPDLSASENSLAVVANRLGRTDEAEAGFRRALAQREAHAAQMAAGNGSRDGGLSGGARPLADANNAVAQTLNNLAGLLRARAAERAGAGDASGREAALAEAERHYRRALALRREWMGPGHPETAKMHNNYARCLQDMGRLEEAERGLRDALELLLREPGEAHRFTALTMRNLADVLAERGNVVEALSWLDRAEAIQRQILPAGHPDLERMEALRERLRGGAP